MVFGAIARAVSKAGKAAKKASRAKRAGDVATNARKRYYRAAERELKKADKSTGATASRFRQLARQYFEDALSTYDPTTTQKFSKPIQKLANTFGVDLNEYRRVSAEKNREEVTARRKRVITRSANILEGSQKDEEMRREREARMLLSDDRIGSRIMGGFVDIWKEDATVVDSATGILKVDNKKIMRKMMDYFEVDNYADLLDKIENITGERLYSNPENDFDYESVKILIQTHIAEREYAA